MLDKMPVKTRRFNLTAEYDGWWCDVRVNAPLGVFLEKMEAMQKIVSENNSNPDPVKLAPALYDLLELVIVEWNFKDENGTDLPCSRDGLKYIPFELLLLITEAINKETLSVPLASGSS